MGKRACPTTRLTPWATLCRPSGACPFTSRWGEGAGCICLFLSSSGAYRNESLPHRTTDAVGYSLPPSPGLVFLLSPGEGSAHQARGRQVSHVAGELN